MKTRMMKKLISIVCALTMVTSCVSMSVGAVPRGQETEQEVNWAQSPNLATNLINRARDLSQNNWELQDCIDLAYDLEEFFYGPVCYTILIDLSLERQVVFSEGFSYILTKLRSPSLEERQLGSGYTIDLVSDIEELIEEYIH